MNLTKEDNHRFYFRYLYDNKLYDVFAINFFNKIARLVSFDAKEILEKHIDINKLLLCTSLEDKNGKWVYEGDIVRLFNNRDNFEEIRLVVFKDCAFQFSLPNSTVVDKPLYCWAINYLNHYKNIEIEVIGNIYENPELLKDEKGGKNGV